MKKQFVLLLLIALLGAGSAVAQSVLKVNVPFNFVVADQTLPAGEYYLASFGSNGIVRVRDFSKHISIFTLSDYAQRRTLPEVTTEWMAVPTEASDTGAVAAFKPVTESGYNSAVFNKYGDKYFLSTMWLGFSGRTFKQGKIEREVKAAELQQKNETVALAAIRIR
jgi:hypothetical protein